MKTSLRPKEYFDGLAANDRVLFGRALTLIESTLPQDRKTADELLRLCLEKNRQSSIRIGVTGSPGAGKSTFIESIGEFLTAKHKRRVAVLAVDPSSVQTRGSILGDKTRMPRLSVNPQAFVRPSPSSGNTGGVGSRTREAVILCEAAGYDTILIETVGVGQSQLDIRSMVDFLILLILAGGGDTLQGMKRGIMEAADLLVITKADGTNVQAASLAKTEYQTALSLQRKKKSGWEPKVLTCSALRNAIETTIETDLEIENNLENTIENKGIEAVWKTVQDYIKKTLASAYFLENRTEQSLAWIKERMQEKAALRIEEGVKQMQDSPENAKWQKYLLAGRIGPDELAQKILKQYTKDLV